MAGSLQKIYLFCSRGERIYFFMRKSKPIFLLSGGLLLKERICSIGEQILSFISNPQIISDTVSNIKAEYIFFFIFQRVLKTKMSGENQEKSGNFEVNDKWKPWTNDLFSY